MITATKPRDAGREAQLAEYGVKAAVEWADNQQLVITLDLGQFNELCDAISRSYDRGYETGFQHGHNAAYRDAVRDARTELKRWASAVERAGAA